EKEKQLKNQLLKKDTDVEPSINLTSHESNNNFYNFKKVLKYEEKKPNFNIHKCHKVKIIVAGTSFRQKEIKRLLRNFDYYEKYDGLSTRDIKENYYEGDKIYEIPLSAIHYGNCELIPEPSNKYDKNAIKVIIDKIHVGYIPCKDCTFINGILNDIKDIDIEVYGGKYKEIYFDEEDYKEKVKINEKNLGILLYISYLDRG
ncbi:HIRAN domain-containing protein, partial [Peptostreptococcus russellii]